MTAAVGGADATRRASRPMAVSNSPRPRLLRSITSKPLARKLSRAIAAAGAHRDIAGKFAYWLLVMTRAMRDGSERAAFTPQQVKPSPRRMIVRRARLMP